MKFNEPLSVKQNISCKQSIGPSPFEQRMSFLLTLLVSIYAMGFPQLQSLVQSHKTRIEHIVCLYSTVQHCDFHEVQSSPILLPCTVLFCTYKVFPFCFSDWAFSIRFDPFCHDRGF